VANDHQSKLEQRVVRAAEAALSDQQFVSAVDVRVGLGWSTPRRVNEWRQGRVNYLAQAVQANLHKISSAMAIVCRSRAHPQRDGVGGPHA
jgi:hypothetical protein